MRVKLLILATAVTVGVMAIVATVYNASVDVQVDQIDLETKQQQIDIKSKELKNIQTELEKKDSNYEELQKQNNKLQKDIEALQAKKAEEKRIAEAKRKSIAESAFNAVTHTQSVQASAPEPANGYKAFIYQKESGNNPNAVNSIGCRGLGQACPGTKLPCGADYACQDAYFTNYAMTRYGSWEKAYQFWIANNWW